MKNSGGDFGRKETARARFALYGDARSGNCMKIVFAANFLGVPHDFHPVDIAAGETRTSEFLALNPAGQVPVVRFPDGRTLSQSNAVLLHLAEGTALVPSDPFRRAEVWQWMFWEQYSHEPRVAVCRSRMLRGGSKESRDPGLVRGGEAALDLMEKHLRGRDYLVGDSPTVADIALVAYTRVAHEGGFDLCARPNLRGWIARVERDLGIAGKGGD